MRRPQGPPAMPSATTPRAPLATDATRHAGPRPLDLPTPVPLAPDADLSVLDEAKVFAAPDDPADWPAWRSNLHRWRREARARLGYAGPHYAGRPTPPYALAFVDLGDEALFDRARGRFDVDGFLAASEREFGGIDGVLLWHGYPTLGIDERRQVDFYRDLPDLPAAVARFREGGVRVFVAMTPWPEGPDAHADGEVADLVAWTGADGLFLDLAREGTRTLRAALAARGLETMVGGESRVPLARLDDHEVSWAQWFADSDVPGVARSVWYERAHQLHQTRRWHRDHLGELHAAWLNGCGVLLWESVFGTWVGWNARDRALWRRMRRVQRAHDAWLRRGAWTPLADHPGGGARVYASRWDHDGATLWTIVNRGGAIDGPWLRTEARPDHGWTEATTGRTLTPSPAGEGVVEIGGPLEAGGVAAVFAGPLAAQVAAAGRASGVRVDAPVGAAPAGDVTFPLRIAVRVPAPDVRVARAPAGMAAVAGGPRELRVRYRVRECGLYGEAPFVDEWKPPLGVRLHQVAVALRRVDLAPFAIDTEEVSVAAFAGFVRATGHRPARAERFPYGDLTGSALSDAAEAAATFVDLEDARAYARWRGVRLPTEDEWQVAAEAGLLDRRPPVVWNLTESEHTDGRARFAILKGGSAYANARSPWFFDGGPRAPEWSAKLLLPAGGLARSAWIGFRCAIGLDAGR